MQFLYGIFCMLVCKLSSTRKVIKFLALVCENIFVRLTSGAYC